MIAVAMVVMRGLDDQEFREECRSRRRSRRRVSRDEP
jgi:hypothetical protein